ncbi:MAG: type II secretion system major pseudopilin GspG [Planctomycetota bacterium]|nr:type II secretion system major pseudopilin GspG [Planctomycetota bacterium]
MNRTSQAGFSLVELMVVVTIIAILAVVVVGRFAGYTDKAKVTRAQSQISEYASALQLFKMDVGRFPTSGEGLESLDEKPAGADGWKEGGYADVMNDPWGNPYEYRFDSTNNKFDIISYGADGTPGGEGYNADIKYSERKDWEKPGN